MTAIASNRNFRPLLDQNPLGQHYVRKAPEGEYELVENREKKLPTFKILSITREFLGFRSDSQYIKNARSLANHVIEKNKDSPLLRNLYLRCMNLYYGNGFKTNSEVADDILTQCKAIEDERKSFQLSDRTSFKTTNFWTGMRSNRGWNPWVYFDNQLNYVKNIFCKFKAQNSVEGKIPKTIHIIWVSKQFEEDNAVPERVQQIVRTWKKHHPLEEGWTVKVWTNKEVKEFFETDSTKLKEYKSATECAEKADILRAQILFREGGIYADTDMVCLKSFKDFVESGLDFFAGQEHNSRYPGRDSLYLCNALIGSKPKIKIIADYADGCKAGPSETILERTGPVHFTRCVQNAIHRKETNFLILPCSYFYPVLFGHNLERYTIKQLQENFGKKETMAIHLWDGTWTP